jgi:Zn-dependent M32 family carboxypeptidase
MQQRKDELADEEKEKIFKELASVKKTISDIRKTSENFMSDIAVLETLLIKQRELTQLLARIECGENNYEVDKNEVKKLLHDFLNIQALDENLVSKLIKKIEVGEAVVTEDGPKRDITITYSFEKI